jgi:hypothetical protein
LEGWEWASGIETVYNYHSNRRAWNYELGVGGLARKQE